MANPKHTALAHKLSSLPSHQNPLMNHGALAAYKAQVPAAVPALNAIAADPQLAHTATQGQGVSTMPSRSLGTAPVNSLNPRQGRSRMANVRHQIVGFSNQSLGSAATVTVSAIPYQDFKATRCVISSITIAGGTDTGSAVSNWQVGTTPQFASLDAEPISMFASGNQATFQDFDLCQASLSISATVKVAASTTFYGCLIGETPNQAPQPRPARTKVARLPIKSTSIAPSSTIVVTATPTVDFWGRKIVLADAGANQFGDTLNVTAGANGASGLLLQEIYVANVPQFLSAPTASANTPYVPCSAFMGLYDMWLDLDKASVAVPYTFQVYNPGTVTLLFAGVIEGDIAC